MLSQFSNMITLILCLALIYQVACIPDGCFPEGNTDYPGNDMPDMPQRQVGPGHCCTACNQTPSCLYWSYNENTLECWLKNDENASETRQPSGGFTSGQKVTIPAPLQTVSPTPTPTTLLTPTPTTLPTKPPPPQSNPCPDLFPQGVHEAIDYCTNANEFDNCAFTCPKGYIRVSGDDTFVCLENGWVPDTSQMIECRGICPRLSAEHVVSPCIDVFVGELCYLECQFGYDPAWALEYKCTENMEWTPSPNSTICKVPETQTSEGFAFKGFHTDVEFSGDIQEYNATVPYSIHTVEFSFDTYDSTHVMLLLLEAADSEKHELEVGQNKIAVNTTAVYTFNVNRTEQATDSRLSALYIGGEFKIATDFTPETLDYDAVGDFQALFINVFSQKRESHAQILGYVVNGKSMDQTSAAIDMEVGMNSVDIVIQAEDENTTTYKIAATRGEPTTCEDVKMCELTKVLPNCGQTAADDQRECVDDFYKKLHKSDNDYSTSVIASVISFCVLIIFCVFWRYGRKRDKFIYFKDLKIGAELASGNFGKVFTGTWIERNIVCKVPNKKSGMDEWDELIVLRTVSKHPNFVKFRGLCADFVDNSEGGDAGVTTAIILEFIPHGSLEEYVLNAEEPLSELQIATCALGMANGLNHLHEHHFIHRDVALRNFLLRDTDPLVAVLTDFGLARSVGRNGICEPQASRVEKLPWRSMDLDVLTGRKRFTQKLDVWMFGICLWQLVSVRTSIWAREHLDRLGTLTPWAQQRSSHDLKKLLGANGENESFIKFEVGRSSKIQDIVRKCCNLDRDCRPDMKSVIQELEEIVEANRTTRSSSVLTGLSRFVRRMRHSPASTVPVFDMDDEGGIPYILQEYDDMSTTSTINSAVEEYHADYKLVAPGGTRIEDGESKTNNMLIAPEPMGINSTWVQSDSQKRQDTVWG